MKHARQTRRKICTAAARKRKSVLEAGGRGKEEFSFFFVSNEEWNRRGNDKGEREKASRDVTTRAYPYLF